VFPGNIVEILDKTSSYY